MSMGLYLWKAPVTDDEVEAGKLVDSYFEAKEQGIFEPSPDIAAAAEELLRLYPYWPVSGEELLASMSDEEKGRYTEQGLADLLEYGSYNQAEDEPWSDIPFHQTGNLLVLNIRWSADNKVLDDIVRIGRERELVIYDPQGPSVYLPNDPVDTEPDPPMTLREALKTVPMAIGLVGLTIAAWFIPIGWLRWPAMIVAGFLASAALMVCWLCIGGALGLIKDQG